MDLIVITQPNFFNREVEIIHQLFEQGLTCLHLRKPNASDEELGEFLSKIQTEYRQNIMIHDHFELADKFGLKGIHFTHRTKKMISEDWRNLQKSVGCHSISEIREIEKKVNYAFLSPVFDSISKEGYSSAFKLNELEIGLKLFTNFKIYALGGVKPGYLKLLQESGFSGAATLGDIWQNDNPVNQFKLYQKQAALCDHLH